MKTQFTLKSFRLFFVFILMPLVWGQVHADLGEIKKKEIGVLDRLIERADHKKFPSELYYRRATAHFELMLIERNSNGNHYKFYLNNAEKDLSKIAEKDKKFKDISQVYLMRAQVYERMGKIENALNSYKDYLSLKLSSSEKAQALLRVSFLYSEKKDFLKMFDTLKQIRLDVKDPSYYLWLKQLIFASRNAKDLEASLRYTEQAFDHVLSPRFSPHERNKEVDFLAVQLSEIFFAIHLASPGRVTHERVLSTFEKISNNTAVFSRLVQRYSQLMRVQGNSVSLIEWVNTVTLRPLQDSLKITLYIELLDYLAQFIHQEKEKNEYVSTLEKMTKLAQSSSGEMDGAAKIKDKLTQSQHFMVQRLQREKDSAYQNNFRFALSKIYENLAKLNDGVDDKKLISIYNLAENQFGLKKYLEAFRSYHRVKTHGESSKVSKKIIKDSHLKAIASYYEYMREQNKGLERPLQPKAIARDQELPATLTAWLNLLEEYYQLYSSEEKIQNYYYEAARIVYFQGNFTESFARFNHVIQKEFKEDYKIASISLVLDTLQKSERWNDVYVFAHDLVKNHAQYKVSSQYNQFLTVGALSFLKKTEDMFRQNKFNEMIDESKKFLTEYPTTVHHNGVGRLAGNAALKLGNKDLAVQFYQHSLKHEDSGDLKTKIIGLNANENEKKYEFELALGQYLKFISELTEKKLSEEKDLSGYQYMLQRSLQLSWFTRSPAGMGRLLAHPLCRKLNQICNSYQYNYDILVFAEDPYKVTQDRVRFGLNSTQPVQRVFYQFVSQFYLNSSQNLVEQKNIFLQLAKLKSEIPLDIYSLLQGEIEKKADQFFTDYQRELYRNSPLALQPQAIQKRSQSLAELEKTYLQVENIFTEEQQVKFLYHLAAEYRKTSLELVQSIPPQLSDEEKAKLSQVVSQLSQPLKNREKANIQSALGLVVRFGVSSEYDKIKHHSNLLNAKSNEKRTFIPSYPVSEFIPRAALSSIQLAANNEGSVSWKNALIKSYDSEQWPFYLFLVQEGIEKNFLVTSDQAYFLGILSYSQRRYSQAIAYFQSFINSYQGNRLRDFDSHALTAFVFEKTLKVNNTEILKGFAQRYSRYLERKGNSQIEVHESNALLLLVGMMEAGVPLSTGVQRNLRAKVDSKEFNNLMAEIKQKRSPAQINLDDWSE